MQIAQLKVRIGDHKISFANCTDENPDIRKLLEIAMSSSTVVSIEVPQDEETASALGRLTYNVPKYMVGVVDTNMIIPLSKRVNEIVCSTRIANCLQNANIEYIWQLCQYTESDVLKLKNFGRRSLIEIREILTDMGLRLGMDLSKVRDHLPNPTS
ncbi:MAG: DNA-directed RNA polymerase subunit alpha C-terminal domain-containing protein [Candidatus Uhrbacteria bacterium]|nr:DNA-directed RNA polymerase subunit alpha C-terminal domain-containing protein [Candidatus Uhrbacteria bacterium]